MPEGAPVNTGAVTWPDPCSAEVAVRRMQTKLHRWAGEDPSRRFGDLLNLVYDPAFLVHAWERVSTNKGARTAGIDKVTAAMIETSVGVGAFLGQIRDSLKSGEFRPVEVRQAMIPKGNSGKFRKLGIPTIADRVVQASLKLVLEPIFEADFKPCSYGFRPNRRAQDAIAEIHHATSGRNSYLWVFEAGIRACFDEISHTALMNRLRVRIKDKRICTLVKAFLKSGIFTELGDPDLRKLRDEQGHYLRERHRALCGSLLNPRTVYRRVTSKFFIHGCSMTKNLLLCSILGKLPPGGRSTTLCNTRTFRTGNFRRSETGKTL